MSIALGCAPSASMSGKSVTTGACSPSVDPTDRNTKRVAVHEAVDCVLDVGLGEVFVVFHVHGGGVDARMAHVVEQERREVLVKDLPQQRHQLVDAARQQRTARRVLHELAAAHDDHNALEPQQRMLQARPNHGRTVAVADARQVARRRPGRRGHQPLILKHLARADRLAGRLVVP
eukprot:365340-Chlamydomonas_euryale.AAC.5